MMNRRERFLAGRKRGKKLFKRIHSVDPDNQDAMDNYLRPAPITYVDIPELDDIIFSDAELKDIYKLKDSSHPYYTEARVQSEIGVLSNTRSGFNCRHECCHNPRRWYRGSKKKSLTKQELSQIEKDKCEW